MRKTPEWSQGMTTRDEKGRIKDPDLAREMAKAEDPYRSKKRFFGILGPSKEDKMYAEAASHNIEQKRDDENKVYDALLIIAEALNKKHKLNEKSVELRVKRNGYSSNYGGPGGRGATLYLEDFPLIAINLDFDNGKFYSYSLESFKGYNLQAPDSKIRHNLSQLPKFLEDIEQNVGSYSVEEPIIKAYTEHAEFKKEEQRTTEKL